VERPPEDLVRFLADPLPPDDPGADDGFGDPVDGLGRDVLGGGVDVPPSAAPFVDDSPAFAVGSVPFGPRLLRACRFGWTR
jgi:hypothetical protein